MGALILLVASVGAAEAPSVLRFAQVDGVYRDLDIELAPVEQGVVTIGVASPTNELSLIRHEVRLWPLGGGQFRAELEIDIEGSGRVAADVSLGGAPAHRVVDDLRLPPQRFVIPGEIELRREEAGLVIVPRRLPPAMTVRIESGLGRQLALACASVPMMPCAGIESMLSTVRVPMPPAGQPYLLPRSLVTDEEWAQLGAWIDSAPSP